jgi:hypothetical protein
MRRKVVTIHIGVTSGLLGGLMLLFKYGDRSTDRSLYHTVHLTALSVVSAAVYYSLFEFCRQLSPPDWGLRRRGEGQAYASVEPERAPLGAEPAAEEPPPTPRERPRLTMGSIWALVYGLGFVFFVTLYSVSGQQTICSYFFGLGLASMTSDEILRPIPNTPHGWRQRALEALAVVFATAGIVLASMHYAFGDDTPYEIMHIDLFSVLAGAFLPLLCPLLLGLLKNPTGYCVGDMMELCEFGLPFMFILGSVFVVMADAQTAKIVQTVFTPIYPTLNMNYTGIFNVTTMITPNNTYETGWQELALMAPVVALAPLLGLPALLFITTATLREHVSDPLAALALVVAGKTVVDGGLLALGQPLCLCALVAAKLGVLARVASTSYESAPRPCEASAA